MVTKQIKSDVSRLLGPFLELVVDEECKNYKPGFESLESFRKRRKLQFEGAFVENFELFQEGIALLLSSNEWTEEEVEHFKKVCKSGAEIKQAMNAMNAEKGVPDTVQTVGDIFGFDEVFYNKAFLIAAEALDKGRFEDAKKMFMALAQVNPAIFQFSEGLGHALAEEGHSEEALFAFVNALQLANEEEVYRLSLIIANMLLVLGQTEKAREAAQAIIEQIGDDEAYSEELAMAKALIN